MSLIDSRVTLTMRRSVAGLMDQTCTIIPRTGPERQSKCLFSQNGRGMVFDRPGGASATVAGTIAFPYGEPIRQSDRIRLGRLYEVLSTIPDETATAVSVQEVV